MRLTSHRGTLMGQLLLLIPRQVFDHVVNNHAWQGTAPRKFPHWLQGDMLDGLLSGRKSLQELVFSLNRQTHPLEHLGCTKVKGSTLVEANEPHAAFFAKRLITSYWTGYMPTWPADTPSPPGLDVRNSALQQYFLFAGKPYGIIASDWRIFRG